MTTDEVRELITATIPEGEPGHIKLRLLADHNAMMILARAIEFGVAPLKSVLNIKEGAIQVLLLHSIKGMITEGLIDLNIILALAEPPSVDFLEFFALEYYGLNLRDITKKGEYKVLQRLVSESKANHEQLFYLKTSAYILLMNEDVRKLVREGEMPLSKLQKLADITDKILQIKGVCALITNRCISMGDLFNFIDRHGNNAYVLGNPGLQKQIQDRKVDIGSLGPIEVGLLQINYVEIASKGMRVNHLMDFSKSISKAVAVMSASYLRNLTTPETLIQFHCFMQLMLRMQKEGLGAMWKQIENGVANNLFPVFIGWCSHEQVYEKYRQVLPDAENGVGFAVYEHNSNHKGSGVIAKTEAASSLKGDLEREACAIFRKCIQAGRQQPAIDLSVLQEKVISSSGYQKYLSSLIYSPIFFKIAGDVSGHGKKALEDQSREARLH